MHPAPAPKTPCAVCHRRPTTDRACAGCVTLMTEQLAYLQVAHRRLPLAQIPTRSGDQEKVRATRSAPLPLRLDPLSLTADGRDDSDVHDAFVPATTTRVERRTVPELTMVNTGTDDEPTMTPTYVDRECDVTVREPVLTGDGRRVLVAAGDQGGVLPLPVWTRAWVLDWRTLFGHSVPVEPVPRLVAPAVEVPPFVGAGWVRTPFARALLARYLAAVHDLARREMVRDRLGIGAGHRTRMVEERGAIRYVGDPARPHQPDAAGAEPDPTAREWTIRYGQAPEHLALGVDVRYLTTWLAEACDRHPDIAMFAASLRGLHAACARVLGDADDKTYLGRCPTGHVLPDGTVAGRELTDRSTGEPTVCGTHLWQDPHVSVIACPRCRHEYGPREHLRLAGWIRLAWPVDRRRRYTLPEADDIQSASAGQATDLRMPRCPDCGRPMAVAWARATERGDRESMWRIAEVTCPAGCDADARLSA